MSFECLDLSISASQSTVIVTVYRSPKIKEASMSEFANLLSLLCFKFNIPGDYNIQIDNSTMAKDFFGVTGMFQSYFVCKWLYS